MMQKRKKNPDFFSIGMAEREKNDLPPEGTEGDTHDEAWRNIKP